MVKFLEKMERYKNILKIPTAPASMGKDMFPLLGK